MSGSQVKKLRARVAEGDVKLKKRGWRRLKRAYQRNPALDIHGFIRRLAEEDVERMTSA
jgi:hypothetical protein